MFLMRNLQGVFGGESFVPFCGESFVRFRSGIARAISEGTSTAGCFGLRFLIERL